MYKYMKHSTKCKILTKYHKTQTFPEVLIYILWMIFSININSVF